MKSVYGILGVALLSACATTHPVYDGTHIGKTTTVTGGKLVLEIRLEGDRARLRYPFRAKNNEFTAKVRHDGNRIILTDADTPQHNITLQTSDDGSVLKCLDCNSGIPLPALYVNTRI